MTNCEAEKLLALTVEGDAIRRLLSGNDSQCFTTEQYGEAIDAAIAVFAGATREELGLAKPAAEVRRRQLLAFSPITEVSPDVWTLKSLVNP